MKPPTDWPWRSIGAGTLITAILAAVGGPAAVASYRHAWTVADRYGTDPTMNPWLPLTTDGMIVAALTVLVVRRWRRVHVGAWPVLWALLGFAATLAANLAAVSTGSWIAAIAVPVVAVWPPIAFAVTLELVVTLLRPGVSTPGAIRRWWTRTSDPATTFVQHRSGFHVPADTPTLAWHADQDPVDAHADDLDAVFDRDRLTAATAPEPTAEPPVVTQIRDVEKITDDDRRIIAAISERLMEDPHSDIPTARAIRSEFSLGKPRADRIHRYMTGTLETVQ
jgi:hypothetical protein